MQTKETLIHPCYPSARLLLAAAAALTVTSCSILPEPTPPIPHKSSSAASSTIDLGDVIVIGHSLYENDGGGSGGTIGGGGDYGGGWGNGGGITTQDPGAGGSGGEGTTFPSGIDHEPADIQQNTPTLGNYSATLAIHKSAYQVINVLVELDTKARDLKKVVVTLNGVTWFSALTQVGDGTLTGYDAKTDTYSFQVSFRKDLGGYMSSQSTIYGTISPSQGQGTLTIP